MDRFLETLPDRQRYDQEVAWDQVQSLVRRPYAHWRYSAHLVLSIHDTRKARNWLRRLLPRIRMAGDVYPIADPDADAPKRWHHRHWNIAFTADGLRKLGLDEEELNTFERAFVEGMAPEPVQRDDLGKLPWQEKLIRTQGTTRRAGILGDLRENHSSLWEWGGTRTGPDGRETTDTASRVMQHEVDILLMVFGTKREHVDRYVTWLLKDDRNGVRDPVCRARKTKPAIRETELSDYEHFGFKDGISQPLFPDTRKAKAVGPRWRALHQVAAGEFILGYLNERDERAEVPWVKPDFMDRAVPARRQPASDKDSVCEPAFGRNGTYLVARQLHQDLAAFDALVEQAAGIMEENRDGLTPPRTSIPPRRRAAEMLIGRGMDGEPLSNDVGEPYVRNFTEPGATHAIEQQEWNDFTFYRTDQAGLLCPIGSHVRRTNPRDSLEPSADVSLSLSKQHRILRRGRIYGPKVQDPGFQRHKGEKPDTIERGLMFICLNTDIAGQFEFIQDSWVNNPNFGDLEGERDPVLSVSIDTRVSLPARPFTRWFNRGRPLVTVRGGAYFFLPGRKALEMLAHRKNAERPEDAGCHEMFNGTPAGKLVSEDVQSSEADS